LSVKDVAEIWYRATYFAVKYETFSDLGAEADWPCLYLGNAWWAGRL